jgi:hypothetical protein
MVSKGEFWHPGATALGSVNYRQLNHPQTNSLRYIKNGRCLVEATPVSISCSDARVFRIRGVPQTALLAERRSS